MGKVRFGQNESARVVELQVVATTERQQADNASRERTRMVRRLREFYDAIDYVVFPEVAEDAPVWAENWVDWITIGIVPVPETANPEEVPEEPANPEEGPEEPANPEDEPPPPAAAAG